MENFDPPVKRLFSTLGRLPGTPVSITAIFLAGATEGIGITLFVPLLGLMSSETSPEPEGIFGYIIDAFQAVGGELSVIPLLICISALILTSQLLSYLQNVLIIKSQLAYARDARVKIVQNLFYSHWPFLSEQSHGDICNRLISETHRSSHALRFEVLAVGALLQIILFIGLSYLVSWQLLILPAIFGALVFMLLRPLHRRGRVLGDQTTKANTNLTLHAIDFLKGAKLVKATANEKPTVERIAKHISRLTDVLLKTDVNMLRVYYIVQATPVILLTAVIAFSSEVFSLPLSTTLVFLILMARIAPRIAQFQQNMQGYASYCAGFMAVEQLLNESSEAQEDLHVGGKVISKFQDNICIENLSFSYPETRNPVLKDVNLKIECNQIVAFCGRSGSGKSTLIDLILGLRRAEQGSLFIDGCPIEKINLRAWRKRIGYVSQEIVIFNDTIRNNLLLVRPDADEKLLEECIRLSSFAEVIKDLPKGLDTPLGEGGIRLSGGQRQRLALARALISEPDVLLLDEATSALDNESERLVQRAIESISTQITIIIIAHRLSTVQRADQVYLLESGKIIESGTFDELMALGGKFHKLAFIGNK